MKQTVNEKAAIQINLLRRQCPKGNKNYLVLIPLPHFTLQCNAMPCIVCTCADFIVNAFLSMSTAALYTSSPGAALLHLGQSTSA